LQRDADIGGFVQDGAPELPYRPGFEIQPDTGNPMQLGYTILYVENVQRSLDFYEAAFGLQTKFLHDSGDYGELNTGSTTLAFSSHQLIRQLGKKPSKSDAHSPCFEIALVTTDVAAAVQKAVAAGAELIQQPQDMPWGQTIAYVADQDGVLVEICTPVGG
jgi:catechol 2,3-dioxygenase-like lactoylglutathione lyase family enzyme